MSAMKFIMELDIGLTFLMQAGILRGLDGFGYSGSIARIDDKYGSVHTYST